MSALTNINALINDEMEACSSRKYKSSGFFTKITSSREKFNAECKIEAQQKFYPELMNAIAEDNALSASLNDATMNAVNNRFPVWNIAAILIITSIILYIILKS